MSLILYNPIVQDQRVSISRGTAANFATPYLVGGRFSVTSQSTLYGVGTTSLVHAPFTLIGDLMGAVEIRVTSGFSNPYLSNTSFVTGCPVIDLTTRANIASGNTVNIMSFAAGTSIYMNNAVTTSSNQTVELFGPGKQFFQVWDLTSNTVIDSLVVLPGLETTTRFTTPITLVPGRTYAVVSVVYGHLIPASEIRDVTAYSNEIVHLEGGIIHDFSSLPSGSFYSATGGTVTSTSNNYVVFSGDRTSSIFVGDWARGTLLAGDGNIVVDISFSGGNTTVYFNANCIVTGSGTLIANFFNAGSLMSVVATTPTLLTNGFVSSPLWRGDFFLDIQRTIQEPIPTPPAPTITSGLSSFTITLDSKLLPTDLTEWDLQYAKSVDNFAFTQWLDIGTFPALTQTGSADDKVGVYTHACPDTTDPLPFYIYRYRLRAHHSQSRWSEFAYAGRVTTEPAVMVTDVIAADTAGTLTPQEIPPAADPADENFGPYPDEEPLPLD